METNDFNPLQYFSGLCDKNLLCKEHGFKPICISGPDGARGLAEEYRREANFIAIDDTTDNSVHYARPGWFTQKQYTVWIIKECGFGDDASRDTSLKVCKGIFRQFLSRMLSDKSHGRKDMMFLRIENVLYRELGRYSFNGATGLYFMIENDVPTDLTYQNDEWES